MRFKIGHKIKRKSLFEEETAFLFAFKYFLQWRPRPRQMKGLLIRAFIRLAWEGLWTRVINWEIIYKPINQGELVKCSMNGGCKVSSYTEPVGFTTNFCT